MVSAFAHAFLKQTQCSRDTGNATRSRSEIRFACRARVSRPEIHEPVGFDRATCRQEAASAGTRHQNRWANGMLAPRRTLHNRVTSDRARQSEGFQAVPNKMISSAILIIRNTCIPFTPGVSRRPGYPVFSAPHRQFSFFESLLPIVLAPGRTELLPNPSGSQGHGKLFRG
jgi:hypothetical protein